MGIEIAVDLIIAGLLSAAIVWAIILDRRLRDLRSGRDGVKQAVVDLINATARAEAAIASLRAAADDAGTRLASTQAVARTASDELAVLVGAAEGLADRLAARRAEPRPAPRPVPAPFALKGAR